eukprot:2696785-Prymnesium_polylepis.1
MVWARARRNPQRRVSALRPRLAPALCWLERARRHGRVSDFAIDYRDFFPRGPRGRAARGAKRQIPKPVEVTQRTPISANLKAMSSEGLGATTLQ